MPLTISKRSGRREHGAGSAQQNPIRLGLTQQLGQHGDGRRRDDQPIVRRENIVGRD